VDGEGHFDQFEVQVFEQVAAGMGYDEKYNGVDNAHSVGNVLEKYFGQYVVYFKRRLFVRNLEVVLVAFVVLRVAVESKGDSRQQLYIQIRNNLFVVLIPFHDRVHNSRRWYRRKIVNQVQKVEPISRGLVVVDCQFVLLYAELEKLWRDWVLLTAEGGEQRKQAVHISRKVFCLVDCQVL
jgi:hypothetical protein